jgi:hypothetical protein
MGHGRGWGNEMRSALRPPSFRLLLSCAYASRLFFDALAVMGGIKTFAINTHRHKQIEIEIEIEIQPCD